MYSFHKLVKLGKAKRIPQFCFILILWCFLSTTCVVFGSIAHRARPTSEFNLVFCYAFVVLYRLWFGVPFIARGCLFGCYRTAVSCVF